MKFITVSISAAALLAGCGGGDGGNAAPAAAAAPVAPATLPLIGAGPNGITGNTLCLNADGPGGDDAYALIRSALGSDAIESPSDTVYAPSRPHILEFPADTEVGPHFGILAVDPTDVNLKDETQDRSRTEIKIGPNSPGAHNDFKAHEGDAYVYKWRFKIASGMRFSDNFTHIHQIRANGGPYTEPSLITLTLTEKKMAVRHIPDLLSGSPEFTELGATPLAGIAGKWLDASEEIVYSNTSGRYRLAIVDASGASVLKVDKPVQMWRTGASYTLPKWGIYRKHNPALNQKIDDYLYLSNIAITHGAVPDSACRL